MQNLDPGPDGRNTVIGIGCARGHMIHISSAYFGENQLVCMNLDEDPCKWVQLSPGEARLVAAALNQVAEEVES